MKFRKKPVVIEAFQVPAPDTVDNGAPPWLLGAVVAGKVRFERDNHAGPCAFIDTLEGTMRADQGDWIIQGVKGELYPCKPDIFAATYEPAE